MICGMQLITLQSFSQWVTDGIDVGAGANSQWQSKIAAGAVGDAFITWSDDALLSTDYNILVTRVDANGIILWGASVVVCNSSGSQEMPQIISDGRGGVIIA